MEYAGFWPLRRVQSPLMSTLESIRRVTKNGIAYIKDNWQPTTDSDWQNHVILFPAWGSRCVGADAANTNWWVNHVYQMLKRSWERCVKVGPHRLGEAFYADYMP